MFARVARGHLDHHEIRRFLLVKTAVFWGLILAAWWSYPAENRYSIMSHTFSFLGSFTEEHNPAWWWIFSVAMLFWAASMVPTSLYIRRRFAAISTRGANVGAGLFLLASVGIAIVALFPDAPGPVFGETRWTEIHEKGAVLTAVGFVLGILWHAGLLLRAALRPSPATGHLRHRRMLLPFVFWFCVSGLAAYNQISWGLQYEAMKAAAKASGQSIRSSWGESLHTIYAFPLWENIVIYALFAFLVAFAWNLSHLEPADARARQ